MFDPFYSDALSIRPLMGVEEVSREFHVAPLILTVNGQWEYA